MITLKTAQKIALARLASRVILAARRARGRSADAVVRRGGVVWKLDLTEGIDFSIYLLGGFEPRTLRLYRTLVKLGDTVLDIGANIGSHTLPLAKLAGPQGEVIAFEPTAFGVAKLRANLELNPDLAGRVRVMQTMLVANETETVPTSLYASWPLFAQPEEIHNQLCGRLMNTAGARATTLDRVWRELPSREVHLVKLDVDGHEASVLAGAQELLKACKPPILMELSPYLHDERDQRFDEMLAALGSLGYGLTDADTGRRLPLEPGELRTIIPVGGSRNGLFRVQESRS
jgi:FkbM family methyltransferase